MAMATRASSLTAILKRLAAAAFLFSALSQGANAALITYHSSLGPEAVGATGSGFVTLVFDDATSALSIQAQWSGLSGLTTVAHIHCCTATPFTGTVGVAVTPTTLPGFPAGVSSGSYSRLIDLTQTSSFTAAFLNNFGGGTAAGATSALLSGLEAGRAYFNIHSNLFPGGEIRGFPLRVVPEPGTLALLALALIGVAAASGYTRRQRGRAKGER
jgi:hypothetical protein